MKLLTFEILKATKIVLRATWSVLLILIWGNFVFHYFLSAFMSSVTKFVIDGA